MMTDEPNELTAATEAILLAFSRFLLRNQLSYRSFCEIARWAYHRSALDALGEENAPSAGKLCEIAGFTRSELTRAEAYRQAPTASAEQLWILAMRGLHIWHTKKEFLKENGEPRELDLRDQSVTRGLFASATVDIEVMLNELIAADCVEQTSDQLWRVKSRAFIPKGAEMRYHTFGKSISRLINTLDHNLNDDDTELWLERSVVTGHVTESAQPMLRRISRDQAERLLECLDDWISTNEEFDNPSDNPRSEVGVGVFYFESPTD